MLYVASWNSFTFGHGRDFYSIQTILESTLLDRGEPDLVYREASLVPCRPRVARGLDKYKLLKYEAARGVDPGAFEISVMLRTLASLLKRLRLVQQVQGS